LGPDKGWDHLAAPAVAEGQAAAHAGDPRKMNCLLSVSPW
jgi:hypothetical protein